MTQESALVPAGLLQETNIIRTSAQPEWQKVTAVTRGNISLGKAAPGDNPYSPPRITPAKLEPSVTITIYSGDFYTVLLGAPVEAKVEHVPANQVGKGDVINVPNTDDWAMVVDVMQGETGFAGGKSTALDFKVLDVTRTQTSKFWSYYQRPGQTGEIRNAELRKVVRA